MGLNLDQITDPVLRRKIVEQDAKQNAKQLSKHASNSLRPLEAAGPKRSKTQILDATRLQREKRKGRVGVVVMLIAVRKRDADDDNNIASLKPLRDAIADSLGLDDGDSRIRWEYGQCESRGTEGVMAKIERL